MERVIQCQAISPQHSHSPTPGQLDILLHISTGQQRCKLTDPPDPEGGKGPWREGQTRPAKYCH